MRYHRCCGILLPVPSLPGRGIGDLGPAAHAWVDFLSGAGHQIWQILPINPSQPPGHSPYSCRSAFAIDPLLISPEHLVPMGLLTRSEVEQDGPDGDGPIHYGQVARRKEQLLERVWARWRKRSGPPLYEHFCHLNHEWLENWAAFEVASLLHGRLPWWKWDKPYRNRTASGMRALLGQHDRIERTKMLQFLAYTQWTALRERAANRSVRIVGDVPIYIAPNSADVWQCRECFKLARDGRPAATPGVPPNAANPRGQNWQLPLYNWDRMVADDYEWWKRRLTSALRLFDLVRLDHYNGLFEEWEIPAGMHAKDGKYVRGPGAHFIGRMHRHLGWLPVVPELIGHIPADSEECVRDYGMFQMLILQFGLYEQYAASWHAPHNHPRRAAIYTGTHDMLPIRAWWRVLPDPTRRYLSHYCGHTITSANVGPEIRRMAYQSVAEIAIFQVQDILELDRESRINVPGTARGNWRWRLSQRLLTPRLAARMLTQAQISNRV